MSGIVKKRQKTPIQILQARDTTIAEASGMTGRTDRPLAGWFGMSMDDLRRWSKTEPTPKVKSLKKTSDHTYPTPWTATHRPHGSEIKDADGVSIAWFGGVADTSASGPLNNRAVSERIVQTVNNADSLRAALSELVDALPYDDHDDPEDSKTCLLCAASKKAKKALRNRNG